MLVFMELVKLTQEAHSSVKSAYELLENRQRATVREFESHRLRQNNFDKLLIFKENTGILPVSNQQTNIKTTIQSRDARCVTAFVFLD